MLYPQREVLYNKEATVALYNFDMIRFITALNTFKLNTVQFNLLHAHQRLLAAAPSWMSSRFAPGGAICPVPAPAAQAPLTVCEGHGLGHLWMQTKHQVTVRKD